MNSLVTPAFTPSHAALSALAFIPSQASGASRSSLAVISVQPSAAAFSFATGALMMSSYVSMPNFPRRSPRVVRYFM